MVLLADYLAAVALNQPTTIRGVCQVAGLWKEVPAFEKAHGSVEGKGGGRGDEGVVEE